MVRMAALTDPASVASTIAHVIGFRHTAGMPLLEALPRYLAAVVHAPTLLFFDNFEQVVAAAPLLVSLFANCPLLKIFVTSRAVLHVSGEHEYSYRLCRPRIRTSLFPWRSYLGTRQSLCFCSAPPLIPAFNLREENVAPSPKSVPGSTAWHWLSSWLRPV